MGSEEFRPENAISKQVDIAKTLAEGAEEFGDVFIYDELPPDQNYSFSGEGLLESDAAALRLLALTENGSASLEDEATSKTYTGKIESMSTQRIPGSAKLSFKINLRKT